MNEKSQSPINRGLGLKESLVWSLGLIKNEGKSFWGLGFEDKDSDVPICTAEK